MKTEKVKTPNASPFAPPSPLSSSCWLCPLRSSALWVPFRIPAGDHRAGVPPLIPLILVMRKIEIKVDSPPWWLLDGCPPAADQVISTRLLRLSLAPPALLVIERTSILHVSLVHVRKPKNKYGVFFTLNPPKKAKKVDPRLFSEYRGRSLYLENPF